MVNKYLALKLYKKYLNFYYNTNINNNLKLL